MFKPFRALWVAFQLIGESTMWWSGGTTTINGREEVVTRTNILGTLFISFHEAIVASVIL
jgi:hypothetical protein